MTNGLTIEEDTVRAPPLFLGDEAWIGRRCGRSDFSLFSLAEWRRRSRVARAHAAVNDTVPDGGASDSLSRATFTPLSTQGPELVVEGSLVPA